jgi:hypothetical protein
MSGALAREQPLIHDDRYGQGLVSDLVEEHRHSLVLVPHHHARAPLRVPHLAMHGERLVRRGGGNHALKTTQHHPFWDATDRQWVDAAKLRLGHRLLVHDDKRLEGDGTGAGSGGGGPGAEVDIVRVKNFAGRAVMRDLTVADIHAYYVLAGDTPVLVHNCNSAVELASVDDLTNLATADGKGGLSAAGRAYQKHVDPAKRTPAHIAKNDVGPLKSNADRTMIGNYHVEDIMTDPSVVGSVNHSATAHYGGITRDFRLPGDGRGVRWSMRGVTTFEGFL